MPYSTIADLPPSIRHLLPTHAQLIFLDAFNASRGQYDEPRSFKIAWGAVENAGYLRSPSGRWTRSAKRTA